MMPLPKSAESVKMAIEEAKRIRFENNRNGYGGTYAPGREALKIEPDILKIVSKNIRTILITGTNGKTTVTSMIMHLLRAMKIEAFSNKEGANMLDGITTAFVLNSDENGHCNYPVAIMECDECYVERVAEILKPEALIITNLYDDQTERLISADHTALVLEKAIEAMPYSTICLNQQSEYFKQFHKKAVHSMFFQANEPGSIMVDNKEYRLSLNTPFNFQYENVAAAATALKCLGVLKEDCLDLFYDYKEPFGRFQTFFVKDQPVTIILMKNNKALELIFPVLTAAQNDADLFLGFDDPYDMIWLDKLDETKKKGFFSSFCQVYTCGVCGEDVAKVLNSGSETEKQAAVLTDQNAFIKQIYQRERPLYILTGYYHLLKMNVLLYKEGLVPAFWEA